jgi:(1->4)-alpha-D-glucan 1-alpha-D-glucosylmutase
VRQALHLRRKMPDIFGPAGSYEPLQVKGGKAEHVLAFARGGRAVSILPRLPFSLGGKWEDTMITLPEGTWNNILTHKQVPGGPLEVSKLLHDFPVALLV